MGVQGLWTVLEPCARPTQLAAMNRKRLAVDASIWIYQFLKAVRDKEGHGLRNSHVVGFFRRICKLLWFGVMPVFVFDGGAPALKRATLKARRLRREGHREDAARTAGKLLAVQMVRLAEQEVEKSKRRAEEVQPGTVGAREAEDREEIPAAENLVYVDELGTSPQERKKTRYFRKEDPYHLPELENGIEAMGKSNDPRIMSIEELEDYARQFQNGEDINMYDFSKIDFDGEFFKSLPPADRYNILHAARLRSRLRMGYTKDQLEEKFPNRMDFSRFQIERAATRNHLTQRLMSELGMTGTDLTTGGGRVAGERNREYILVKNEGAEGGWALGVVGKANDTGEQHKPIDVDALDARNEEVDDEEDWEDDVEFEDVPIEGLNRLPKRDKRGRAYRQAQNMNSARRQLYGMRQRDEDEEDDEESLFVANHNTDDIFEDEDEIERDEEEDVNWAIALSLQNQHGVGIPEAPEAEASASSQPQWSQRPVEAPKPLASASKGSLARMVNSRANASVPKRVPQRRDGVEPDSSDSDCDLQTALAAARRKMKGKAPVLADAPSGGELPFEKMDWRVPEPLIIENDRLEDEGGGFVKYVEECADDAPRPTKDDNAPRPLPPWLADTADIRQEVKKQLEQEQRMNQEDKRLAEQEMLLYRQRRQEEIVEIESSSSDDSDDDVEMLEAPPPPAEPLPEQPSRISPGESPTAGTLSLRPEEEDKVIPDDRVDDKVDPRQEQSDTMSRLHSPGMGGVELEEDRMDETFADVEFEEVPLNVPLASPAPRNRSLSPDVNQEEAGISDADAPGPEDFDDFSDPEDEELLAQMAEEAETHAQFASQLNNKSEKENQENYERELKALRNQQKKDRRDADEVTDVMVTECQSLLRLFGIPYITAPMEAEAQCAELVRLGLVDGVVTDDSDIFLFGGTRVYKNMFNSNKMVECYLSSDFEKDLSLSRHHLIALAQLLGSDYAEGLPSVGPVTAVEMLSEFPGTQEDGSVDPLTEFKTWWKTAQALPPKSKIPGESTFRRKFRKSRAAKLFLPRDFPSQAVTEAYLKPQVESSSESFQWGCPDLDGLRKFLMSTIGWGPERTDEVLVPVIRDMNRKEAEGTQANITAYFSGAAGVGAAEPFAPRQRAAVGSKRMLDAMGRLKKGTKRRREDDDQLSTAMPVRSSAAKRGKGKGKKGRGKGKEPVDLDEEHEEDGDREENEHEEHDNGVAHGKVKAKANAKKGKRSREITTTTTS